MPQFCVCRQLLSVVMETRKNSRHFGYLGNILQGTILNIFYTHFNDFIQKITNQYPLHKGVGYYTTLDTINFLKTRTETRKIFYRMQVLYLKVWFVNLKVKFKIMIFFKVPPIHINPLLRPHGLLITNEIFSLKDTFRLRKAKCNFKTLGRSPSIIIPLRLFFVNFELRDSDGN